MIKKMVLVVMFCSMTTYGLTTGEKAALQLTGAAAAGIVFFKNDGGLLLLIGPAWGLQNGLESLQDLPAVILSSSMMGLLVALGTASNFPKGTALISTGALSAGLTYCGLRNLAKWKNEKKGDGREEDCKKNMKIDSDPINEQNPFVTSFVETKL